MIIYARITGHYTFQSYYGRHLSKASLASCHNGISKLFEVTHKLNLISDIILSLLYASPLPSPNGPSSITPSRNFSFITLSSITLPSRNTSLFYLTKFFFLFFFFSDSNDLSLIFLIHSF